MGGRHRFGPRAAPVRRALTVSIPVVAVAGLTVAVLLGGGSPATSTARIEVPGFGPSGTVGTTSTAPAAPGGATPVALASALPVGTVPGVMDVSGAGSSAVQRIKAERAEAAERARVARQRAAEERAARERAAQQRAAQERADALQAQRERAAQQQRQAQQRPAAPSTPASPSPSATPDPRRSTGNDAGRDPLRPGGLLDSLLGSRGN